MDTKTKNAKKMVNGFVEGFGSVVNLFEVNPSPRPARWVEEWSKKRDDWYRGRRHDWSAVYGDFSVALHKVNGPTTK